jgi:hypothetical protein
VCREIAAALFEASKGRKTSVERADKLCYNFCITEHFP